MGHVNVAAKTFEKSFRSAYNFSSLVDITAAALQNVTH